MSLAREVRMLAATAPQPRTLAHALSDINDVKHALAPFYAVGAPVPTEAQDREWDRLEERLYHLRTEAKAMHERLTGVSWDAIERAMA